MPWYKCFIEGENFPGHLIGESSPIGFYTTRFIEASSPDEAEQLAFEKLKTEESLTLPVDATKPSNAKVYFESIEEVPINAVGSNGCFTFFVMGT